MKAVQQGADAIIVTGHEAAAHGGAIANMVFLPEIASKIKIPVISAGGYCDGRGLAAALALGADGIAMGTRFLVTQECEVHPGIKQTALETSMEQTVYSPAIDGLPGRWYCSKLAMRLIQGNTSYIQAFRAALALRNQVDIPIWKLALGSLQKGG